MNKSHVTGGIDQAVGKVKEAVGEATGSEKLADEGAAQQVRGAAKETWGNVKDSASQASKTAMAWSRAQKQDTRTEVKQNSEDLRDRVTTAAQHVKNSIAAKLDNFNKNQEEKRDDIRKAS